MKEVPVRRLGAIATEGWLVGHEPKLDEELDRPLNGPLALLSLGSQQADGGVAGEALVSTIGQTPKDELRRQVADL
ncbi:hypothetical protein EF906_22995 [Streptomyces sp. WAC08241]|nr:hypothetical protein [Streptomyces sp. WAC08241]RSS37445.1 hypothetical protein EF906_22995 [Streptomyces sp. WAC08241]